MYTQEERQALLETFKKEFYLKQNTAARNEKKNDFLFRSIKTSYIIESIIKNEDYKTYAHIYEAMLNMKQTNEYALEYIQSLRAYFKIHCIDVHEDILVRHEQILGENFALTIILDVMRVDC